MYPPGPNPNVEAATTDCETSRFKIPHAASGEKNGSSMDSSCLSSNPSAPLLPSSPHDLAIPDMEPPSYSSVEAHDSDDCKNGWGSFSPHINREKSPSDLDNQAPYTVQPGPTRQLSYPTSDGLTEGVLSMPMPLLIQTKRPIGFTEDVTSEPKSASLGSGVRGHGSTVTDAAPDSINSSSKLIDPRIRDEVLGSTMRDIADNPINRSIEFINSTSSGEYSKFSPRRQQQPNQRAQQRPRSPAQEEISFLEWCLCCCECFECCFEVFLETITDRS